MRYVTNLMINEFNLKHVSCDFMGFKLQKDDLYIDSSHPIQFHHLIVPKRECSGMIDKGYNRNNGALLIQCSHEELHKIEHYERDLFIMITKLMIIENKQGFLDRDTLLKIRKLLEEFECLYKDRVTKKGMKIIKDRYSSSRMTLEELDRKTDSKILSLTSKL